MRWRGLIVVVLQLLQKAATAEWPACILEGQAPQVPQPAFADVRAFIKHPDELRHQTRTYNSEGVIGMVLRETPHEFGEMVEDVVANSQAWAAGVRKGWIITEVNGKRFSTSERLKDVESDFTREKHAGSTLQVTYDVRTAIDCANADCHNSDVLPTESAKHCSIVCGTLLNCEWWFFDVDKMCHLLGGNTPNAGFISATGGTTGNRACTYVPRAKEAVSWPSCVTEDADLHGGTPLFSDVRSLIDRPDDVRHKEIIFTSSGNVGMGLRETPHDLGEVVSEVVPASQAYNAGVQVGWIIKEVAGRPFRKEEKSVDDVVQDFTTAKAASTLTVKFDVKSSFDCTNGNCEQSDKFPAASRDVCAAACSQVTNCESWSFSVEEADDMCWLRSSSLSEVTLRPQAGSVAGARTCRPSGIERSSSVSFNFLYVFLIALAYSYRRELPRLFDLYHVLKKRPVSYAMFMVELGVLNDRHAAGSFSSKELDPLNGGGIHRPASSPSDVHASSWFGSFAGRSEGDIESTSTRYGSSPARAFDADAAL